MLLQKYRDMNGSSTVKLFKTSGSGVDLILLNHSEHLKSQSASKVASNSSFKFEIC